MYVYFFFKCETVIKRELLNLLFVISFKPFFLIKMESTNKNKNAENAKKTSKAPRVKWTKNAIKALLSFLVENKERLKKLKYKCGATSNPENV